MIGLLLLLSVGVLSLTSAATGSLHPLHKRQAGSDQEAVCEAISADSACTNGYYEDYAYIVAQCSERELAESYQKGCSVNGNGVRCSRFDVYTGVSDVCGNSPSTCSSECRDFLTSMRAELGCCVNELNGSSADNPVPFYSLWSLCGIEAVMEQCTPSFTIPTSFPTPCNSSTDLDQLYSRVICRTEFQDSINNALAAASCAALDYDEYTCAINFQGRYCSAIDMYSSLQVARENCTNTNVCEPACRQTLSNIISTYGCCFISEYNGTTQYDFLSAEFWQLCGLTSPGLCEQQFDNSPFRVSNPDGTATNPTAGTQCPTAAAAAIIGFLVATAVIVL